MRQWLYKATDRQQGDGRPRPGLETTSTFTLDDRVLCRSAYDKNGKPIPNVFSVEAGDILHVFFRQQARPVTTHFIGSFRVLDPGPQRVDPGCALVRIDDPDLVMRLRTTLGGDG